MFLGNGTGGFGAPTTTSIPDIASAGLFVGHFTPDNHIDVVIGSTGSPNVLIYTGNGLGGFGNIVQIPTSAATRITAVGDVNGDGRTDVLLEDLLQAGHVTLLFGNPGGFLTNQTEVATGLSVFHIADVNGDGRADLVAAPNANLELFEVLIGNGAGGFAAPVALTLGPPPTVAADFNGDGRVDFAGRAGASSGNSIGVFLNACGQPEANLSVQLSDGVDPVAEGTPVTYTAVITNQGTTTATDLRLGYGQRRGHLVFPDRFVKPIVFSRGVKAAVASIVYARAQLRRRRRRNGPVSTTTPAAAAGPDRDGGPHRASQADPNPSDNSDSETTTINAIGRDIVVTNTNTSGEGSLRQAILDSNSDTTDVDRIVFNIPGAGPRTIAPTSALPTITAPVIIDGTTQPGYAGVPLIELTGTNAGANVNGLSILVGNTTVRGLAINRFTSAGIIISNGINNVIEANYVGTTVNGSAAAPNQTGIDVRTSNNRIGGTTAAARNVVSGNTSTGVSISSSTGNVVQGNYLGLNAAGTAAIPNVFGASIFGGGSNVIGGTDAGARNIISGNIVGVGLQNTATTPNLVLGNYIGLNAAGTSAVPNTSHGVQFSGAATNHTAGVSSTRRRRETLPGKRCNWYSSFLHSTGNRVQGNTIGLNPAGTAPLPNTAVGVSLSVSPGNAIGGTEPGAGNLISANNIGVSVVSGAGNAILGNSIYGNTALGIDLGANGVTPNDQDDPDTGANGALTRPPRSIIPIFVPSTKSVRPSGDGSSWRCRCTKGRLFEPA